MGNYLQILIALLLLVAGGHVSTAQMILRVGGRYGEVINLGISGEDNDSLVIEGRVVESLAKRDLKNSFMIPIDADGNPGDTIKAEWRWPRRYNSDRYLAYVSFKTVRRDSTYVFEIGCPGYTSQTVVYKAERVGKREEKRELPLTVLEREPHKLGEVQVVASKVKFYHRGDTLVYNADAFQLAEGSMLDELIRQLPGVELNKDGQIKVNGEVVETLLLNGKHFFNGDNKLMLENLGAYTVKNVEVYRGQTAVEKWENDPNVKKHLTMDVKLKKEYSVGYLLNAQAGYGTEERYLGRLFASWFSPVANVSLVGNLNNVGDNFSPRGVSDSWSMAGGMPADSRRQNVGLTYDIETKDFKRTAHGSVTYTGDRTNNINNNSVSTYYADNQTHSYSYSRSLRRNFGMTTSHEMMFDLGRVNLSLSAQGQYQSTDGLSSSLSATFNEEQADVTREILESIYTDGSPSALAALINRSNTRSDSKSDGGMAVLTATALYKVPGTSDVLRFSVDATGSLLKNKDWTDYLINYGDNPVPSDRRRQYSRMSPQRNLSLKGTLTYTARINKVSVDFRYNGRFQNGKSDLRMYSLQNLADMGDYGILPPDYMSAFDPANSYISKNTDITHSFSPMLRYQTKFENGGVFFVRLAPEIALTNRRLDYWRDNKMYNVRHKSVDIGSTFGGLELRYESSTGFSSDKIRNSISYTYDISTQLPSMLSLVDIVDDSNPLYIREGNPDLKNGLRQSHTLNWTIGRKVTNSLRLSYSYSKNSMVQASTYDMSTGITRTRAENVSGDNSFSLYDNIWLHFGEFSIYPSVNVIRMHSVDMMSTNGAAPAKTSADTWTLNPDVNVSWSFGKGSRLSFSCGLTNRRTSSDRQDFNKINASHINYGLSGFFVLPAGFEINTDFSLYTRRGYGSKELDTTESMWNMSLSYTPPGRRWVFTVNGYDLLRQVSNISYGVTATGRTVAYTNSLPSYVLATVQYRLNIQPKRKQ